MSTTVNPSANTNTGSLGHATDHNAGLTGHNAGSVGHSNVLGGHNKELSGAENGRRIQHAVTPGGHIRDDTQPAFPIYHRRFANPAPLGLCAFAATTFVLSLINVKARGVATPNIVIGLAVAYGGLAQLIAGIWEFAVGNTFGATAFCSYGAFWLSYAIILIPWFNVAPAYESESAFRSAIGMYLSAWFIFTFIMLISSLRSSAALVSVFFFLTITFLLLFIGEFRASSSIIKAGGAFGIITAFCAWYTALANLLSRDTSYFTLPVASLARKERVN